MPESTTWQHFDLAHVAQEHRRAALNELGGAAMNVDITPTTGSFNIAADVLALPGLMVTLGRNSPADARRRDMSRQTDDFELLWSAPGCFGDIRHLGRRMEDPDAAHLASHADQYSCRMHTNFDFVNLRISRSVLQSILPDVESCLMRPISTGTQPFRLLKGYIETLRQISFDGEGGALARAVADHLTDLSAFILIDALGSTRALDRRGGTSGRVALIKRWISLRAHEPRLTVKEAAHAHGTSVRSIQLMFAAEGTTFSRFLHGERLLLARRMLSKSARGHLTITEIALQCGFGDISHFTRSFRAAFGERPTDCRQRALESCA